MAWRAEVAATAARRQARTRRTACPTSSRPERNRAAMSHGADRGRAGRERAGGRENDVKHLELTEELAHQITGPAKEAQQYAARPNAPARQGLHLFERKSTVTGRRRSRQDN